MKTVKIRVTLNEEMLGTASSDPNLQRTYVASKAPDAEKIEEEVASIGVDAVVEKGVTVFPKENGKPFVFDYQYKGYLKDSCNALARVEGTKASKVKAYKKVIDGLIFPQPRKIMIHMPEGKSLGLCSRPLRAQTAQGERIAIASSESVPEGSYMDVEIKILDDKLEGLLEELLDYGALRGLGQWRNSGKGRFSWARA